MAKIHDTYALEVVTTTAGAKPKLKELDEIIQKLTLSGKGANRMIRDMDDQEFSKLYNNLDGVRAGMKGFKNNIDESVISMRFLTRGLQGFKMDMLNVLFLGMSLSATFGAMRASTSMGQVLSGLGDVFSELTLGQSHILSMMVDSVIGLINIMGNNQEVAALVGDVAVALGLMGTAMVTLATMTMAAGSLFGKEGFSKTLEEIKLLLGGPESGIIKRLNLIKTLATGGLIIAITLALGEELLDGKMGLAEFLLYTGLEGIFKVAKTGAGVKAVARFSILATLMGGLFSDDGTKFSTFESISTAIFAGSLAKLGLMGMGMTALKATPYGRALALGVFLIKAILDPDGFKESLGNMMAWAVRKIHAVAAGIISLFSEDSAKVLINSGENLANSLQNWGSGIDVGPMQGPTRGGTEGITNIFNDMSTNSQYSSPHVTATPRAEVPQ